MPSEICEIITIQGIKIIFISKYLLKNMCMLQENSSFFHVYFVIWDLLRVPYQLLGLFFHNCLKDFFKRYRHFLRPSQFFKVSIKIQPFKLHYRGKLSRLPLRKIDFFGEILIKLRL